LEAQSRCLLSRLPPAPTEFNAVLIMPNNNYALRVVCGKRHKTVECSSVRPTVCLSRRSTVTQRLRSGASSRYRFIAAAAARHTGRENCCATVKRSNILVPSVCIAVINAEHTTSSMLGSSLYQQSSVSARHDDRNNRIATKQPWEELKPCFLSRIQCLAGFSPQRTCFHTPCDYC